MTQLLLDVASYQWGLTPEMVKAAGFSAVNFKVSHGLGAKSVHAGLAEWVEGARALGLGLSSFHYMTADAGGGEQADYAFKRMAQYGLAIGAAHQLDVESTPGPTLKTVRDYLTRMTQLLDRPVALYTGDWWWKPRGWDVSDLTPYLWSAPDAGYPGSYPGDASPHWTTSYGGWESLAIMQYAVRPLPGSTIKVSMSAIRDAAVWRHLTTGRPTMSYAPDSIMDARAFVMNTLRSAGVTVNPASYGVVGDDSHANAGTGYHLGKDALKATAYSIVESSRDRNGLTNAASAFDIGYFQFSVKGKVHNLRTFSVWLVAQCKAGAADTLDIREVIYSPDGKVVKRWDRLGIRSTGDDSHLGHTHKSYFRDSERRDKTALFRRYFTEIGLLEDPDMPLTNDDADLVVDRLLARQIVTGAGATAVNHGTLNGILGTSHVRLSAIVNTQNPAIAASIGAVLKNVTDDDAVVTQVTGQILAAVAEASDDTADAVLDRLGGAGQSDAEIASALRAALGDRAGAVGALLAE